MSESPTPEAGTAPVDPLTLETFQPHCDSVFRAPITPPPEAEPDAPSALELTLIEASPYDLAPRAVDADEAPARQSFALLFRGPKTPTLLQQTVTLEHDALGTLLLFLVPLGPDKDGHMEYEAVFT
ncbi:MAG: hypothetical protein AAF772_10995 [Acidobacteriota bacterium]